MASSTRTLTPSEQEAANALYLRLEELRCSGLQIVLVHLSKNGGQIGVRSVGQRVDLVVASGISAEMSVDIGATIISTK